MYVHLYPFDYRLYQHYPQAGYQITQQRQPIARFGKVPYIVYDPAVNKHPVQRVASITQLQLEQDSGKSLHDADEGHSLIDLNRAGTLIIVSSCFQQPFNMVRASIAHLFWHSASGCSVSHCLGLSLSVT